MKLKRQSRFHHEVATGALNDIMFFLLLFFLIVATVANPQVIKLALPSAENPSTTTPDQVQLTISAAKEYRVGDAVVPQTGLESAIRQAIQGKKDPVVVLNVDHAVDVQTLVSVMDLGMAMQVKMVLQTSTN